MNPTQTTEKKTRRHVVISGTGRAGTSFLMQLLTNLGFDTGYKDPDKGWNEHARAGLEWDVRKDTAPYIVKSPYFCEYAAEVLQREDIIIEHLLIPMRNLHDAAQSRRFVLESAEAKLPLWKRLVSRVKPLKVPGGLWNFKDRRGQEALLLKMLYTLVLAASEAETPVTLLQFPKLVRDSSYLYRKLKPILGTISPAEFSAAFAQAARPEWVHDFQKQADPRRG